MEGTKQTKQARSMSIRHLYPNATEPTEPRFKVGDMVHTSGSVWIRGTGFRTSSAAAIAAHVANVSAEPSEVVVYPPVFGEIVEYQEAGTEIYDCNTLGDHPTTWGGWEGDYEEAELDLPDSGSIWFLPDNERRYFVRWASKEPYQYGGTPTEFRPLMSASGEAVFSLSLFPENQLKRCPDFAGKLRELVKKREMVETVMQERLDLDEYSTTGISAIVCKY